MTPNDVFLLFVAGMLAVCAADIFPASGLIRLAGIGALAAAVYFALAYPIRPAGLICLLVAAGLFAFDFWSNADYLAAWAAALLVPIGFAFLYSGPQRIDMFLATALGLLLGLSTAVLCSKAKRARLNKLADV